MEVTGKCYRLKLNVKTSECIIDDSKGNVFFKTKSLTMFLPRLKNEPKKFIVKGTPQLKITDVQNCKKIAIEFDTEGCFSKIRLFFNCYSTHLEIYSEVVLNGANNVTGWDIFSANKNTQILGDYISGLCTGSWVPPILTVKSIFKTEEIKKGLEIELGIGQKIEIDKEGKTIIDAPYEVYAPSPIAYVFTKGRNNQFFMGIDNIYDADAFNLKMADDKIPLDWVLYAGGDTGGTIYYEDKTLLESPHWIMFGEKTEEKLDCYKRWADILILQGRIKPKERKRHSWWTEPAFCTWGEQFNNNKNNTSYIKRTDDKIGYDFTKIGPEISEENIKRWADIIKQKKLPIKTIIFDDRWMTSWGDAEASDRFLNMRKLIDYLHQKGFKVRLWWLPLGAFSDSKTFREHPEWILKAREGGEKISLRYRANLDYTNPEVQEHLRQQVYKFLSSDKNCYNADGIKVDYFILGPQSRSTGGYFNISWGIGQKFQTNVMKLLYETAKKIKPDALIGGPSNNPFFDQYQDYAHTFDIDSSDYNQHLERARMLSATNTGSMIACIKHDYWRNKNRYLNMQVLTGLLKVYHIQRMHGDGIVLSDDDYTQWREIMNAYNLIKDTKPRLDYRDLPKRILCDTYGRIHARTFDDDQTLLVSTGKIIRIVATNQGCSINREWDVRLSEYGLKVRVCSDDWAYYELTNKEIKIKGFICQNGTLVINIKNGVLPHLSFVSNSMVIIKKAKYDLEKKKIEIEYEGLENNMTDMVFKNLDLLGKHIIFKLDGGEIKTSKSSKYFKLEKLSTLGVRILTVEKK
ncbi:MAG: TIM-barrel domain-containing protein [Candidatus Firestonebacteria bacterium]